MGNIFNFIKYPLKYMKLVSEGEGFKDKIAILLYFPKRLIRGYFNDSPFLWNVTIKNKDGIFKCRNCGTSAFMVSSLNEWWLREEFNLSGGTFIDIGSNIGKYSILVGNNFNADKIISIEPDPKNFKVLSENIRLNNLSDKIIAVNYACSNKKGKLPFYLENTGGGSSLLKEGFFGWGNKNNKNILVKVITIDTLVKKFNLKEVSLIKIDVEGAELEVILGGLKTISSYKPKIILECLDPIKLNKIKNILEAYNYVFKKVPGDNFICTSNLN